MVNEHQARELARQFQEVLGAAQRAKRSQSVAVVAANLEGAAQGWQNMQAIATCLTQLGVPWEWERINVLRQLPFRQAAEISFHNEQALADRTESTFRGEEEKNLLKAGAYLKECWTAWIEQNQQPLKQVEALSRHVAGLGALIPAIQNLRRKALKDPPTKEEEVRAVRVWMQEREGFLKEASSHLDPAVRNFLFGALDGQAWLDQLTEEGFAFLREKGLVRYLKVQLAPTPNPSAATPIPAVRSSDGDDEDWI